MGHKVSPADQFRKQAMDAVKEAGLDFSGYCRPAAQAMPQAAMEVEATEFIGWSAYQRRTPDPSAYRNGFKRREVATGEGTVELSVPQTHEGCERFRRRFWALFSDVARRSRH